MACSIFIITVPGCCVGVWGGGGGWPGNGGRDRGRGWGEGDRKG